MNTVATLCTAQCLDDLKVFFFTLNLWNTDLPKVYIYCDTPVADYIKNEKPYKGVVELNVVLDKYTSFTRSQMEKLPGSNNKSLFWDFVVEKTHLLDWVLEHETSVLFCDADICFMGPLPSISNTIKLGVSRHNIRSYDEQQYGIYNAGYVYVSDKSLPALWRAYCSTSYFFEQGCIEELVKEYCDSYTVFPNTVNYGWWRLLQGKQSVETIKSTWSINRNSRGCGISIDGEGLLSIHTHWKTKDTATLYFNNFIRDYLEKLKSVEHTRKLLKFLKQ